MGKDVMQAIWLEDQSLRFREDVPVPVPGPGEALVRLRLGGICATDLEMQRGYAPFAGVMGHEFVGEVVQAPQGAEDWVGQRVVGEINVSCGECAPCRRGDPTHCAQRQVIGIRRRDGAFAEFMALPLENLHRVPDEIPDEAAVFTEPLAAALEIQQQVPVRPQDRVLLLGAGRLGQLIAQVLALSGCDLRVSARHPRQRELLQARQIRLAQAEDLEQGQFDVVVEATGTPQGFQLARQRVRPRGVLVLKSTFAEAVQLDLSALVVDEITLVGSRCGPFEPALRLLASGRVDPLSMIEGRYPLSQAVQAFEQAQQPGVMKILVER
jgi:threonine dehydrogenase-like Zn-dependent dehydrogenase